jgi:hypothetical protein
MRKNIIIPAAINGSPGVYTENVSEPGFSIVGTDGSFQAFIGSNPAQTLSSGMSVGAASGLSLGRVVFQNTTAANINVTLGDFALARATTIAANAATFVGNNSQLYKLGFGGLGVKSLPGVDGNGCSRKLIYVSNSGRVDIGGAASTDVVSVAAVPAGGTMVIVQPGKTEPIETSADLEIFSLKADLSAVASSLQVAVLEIFYSKPLQTDQ